jgi:hypothetical protein
VEAKLQRGCYLRPQWFVLGPSLPFEPALREALRAGSRERLAKEAAGLRLHRASDAAVREELALDLAEALHGEPSS